MRRNRQSLETYDMIPDDMRAYLRNYGMHFNKKMYEFAVSTMYTEDSNGKEVEVKPDDARKLDDDMHKFGIKMDNNVMYDACYVYTMLKSDFGKIVDEQIILRMTAAYVDDPDKTDGFIFNRFYADCVHEGNPVDWEEML